VGTRNKPGAHEGSDGTTLDMQDSRPQVVQLQVRGSETYPARSAHTSFGRFESMPEAQLCYVNTGEAISRGHPGTEVESQSRKGIMCNQPSLPYAA
jgi:hypothetical protein